MKAASVPQYTFHATMMFADKTEIPVAEKVDL